MRVPLAKALDYLYSPAGDRALAPLRAELNNSGTNEAQFDIAIPLLPGEEDTYKPTRITLPSDPFSRATLQWLFERQLHGADAHACLPQAILSVVAASTTDNSLCSAAVASQFGSQAGFLVDAAGRSNVTAQRSTVKYQQLEPDITRRVVESKSFDFTPRMPVLKAVENAAPPSAFSGWQMASVQHLLPSTLHMYELFERLGLINQQTGVLGKPYSTHEDTYRMMQVRGYAMRPESRRASSRQEQEAVRNEAPPEAWRAELKADIEHHGSYEKAIAARRLKLADSGEQTKAAAKAMLSRLFAGLDPANETQPRFLLLDDGGKLVLALHEYFPEFAHLCVGVEQTDRGIQILEKIELRCPVINMARSEAKKRFESPAIGEIVIHSALAQLLQANPSLQLQEKQATVIGYGAVGRASADALRRRGFLVRVFDIDPAKMKQAEDDGCEAVPRDEALKHAHLLVSATGRTTIELSEYDKLPDGAVLVNAASGNHELGTNKPTTLGFFSPFDPTLRINKNGLAWQQFRGQMIFLGDHYADDDMMHQVVVTPSGKRQLLLRSGNVVNLGFGLPPEFVQLTLGLLAESCLQAATAPKTAGLVDLDRTRQDRVIAGTKDHLAEQALALETPDFRHLASWSVSEIMQAVLSALSPFEPARAYEDGAVIFQRGDAVDGVYVLSLGAVEIVQSTPAGPSVVVKILVGPTLFGVLEGVTAEPHYLESVRCLGGVSVHKISLNRFNDLMHQSPGFAHAVSVDLAHAFACAARFESSRLHDTETLLANLLVAYADLFGDAEGALVRLRIKRTQADLAEAIGASERQVTRILSHWFDTGVLRKVAGLFEILALKELRKTAAPLAHSLVHSFQFSSLRRESLGLAPSVEQVNVEA